MTALMLPEADIMIERRKSRFAHCRACRTLQNSLKQFQTFFSLISIFIRMLKKYANEAETSLCLGLFQCFVSQCATGYRGVPVDRGVGWGGSGETSPLFYISSVLSYILLFGSQEGLVVSDNYWSLNTPAPPPSGLHHPPSLPRSPIER